MGVTKKVMPVGNPKKGKVSGAVVIPKPFLEQLGIDVGSEVEVTLLLGSIVITPKRDS